MSESKKHKDSEPRKPASKSNRFIRRIQSVLSRFLLWLASLLRTPQSRKEAAARFLRGAGTYIADMSPARFTCCLIAIAAIAISIIFFVTSRHITAKDYTNRPTALWFSEMEDNETNKDYLQDDVYNATRVITDALDFFDILACKPKESDPNRIVLNIKVGCYRTKDNGKNELILKIVENGGKEDIDPIGEFYKNFSTIESQKFLKRIMERIQRNVLETYPLWGKIKDLEDISLSETKSQPREMILDRGYLNGVRKNDIFHIMTRNKNKPIGEARITHAMELESSAVLISDSEEVEKGCRVKWKKAGG